MAPRSKRMPAGTGPISHGRMLKSERQLEGEMRALLLERPVNGTNKRRWLSRRLRKLRPVATPSAASGPHAAGVVPANERRMPGRLASETALAAGLESPALRTDRDPLAMPSRRLSTDAAGNPRPPSTVIARWSWPLASATRPVTRCSCCPCWNA